MIGMAGEGEEEEEGAEADADILSRASCCLQGKIYMCRSTRIRFV